MKSYFSFYTYPLFWLELYIDPYKNINDYTRELKIFLNKETEKFSLVVFKDGLIGISLKDLCNVTGKDNLETSFKTWKSYKEVALLITVLLADSLKKKEIEGYIEIQEISIKDFGIIEIDNNGIQKKNFIGLSAFSEIHNKRNLHWFKKPEAGEISNPIYDNRNVFPKELFDTITETLSLIFDTKNIDIYYQFVKSIADYKFGNLTISIVNCWFIIENMINLQWKEWLISKNKCIPNGERINNDRMKNLTNGSNFTISSVIDILELTDQILTDLYKKLSKIRKKRNRITHENEKVIEPELCIICFDIINQLFSMKKWPRIDIDYIIPIRSIDL